MNTDDIRDDEVKFDKLINFVLWIFGAVFLLLIVEFFKIKELDKRGQIGDWLGGHVAAFAGFATAILLIKSVVLQRKQLLMQREELSLTREELKLTRDEMSRGREVHEAQKQQLERQAEIAEKAAMRKYFLAVLHYRDHLWMASPMSRQISSNIQGNNKRWVSEQLQKMYPETNLLLESMLTSSCFESLEREQLRDLAYLAS